MTTDEETVIGEEHDVVTNETPTTIGGGKVGLGPMRATNRSIRTVRKVELLGQEERNLRRVSKS
jgi:hypothetical protein